MIEANCDPEDREGLECIVKAEQELPKRDNLLREAIDNFSTYNYFAKNEQIFVHYLDDRNDGHGCICMPWKISIGLNYAFVELHHGTWY